jgi:uncharacterized membrane protein YhaH (DUF805 family)
VTPLQWILLPLRRYYDFEGRSQRAEYWWFTGANIIVFFALLILSGEFSDLIPVTRLANGASMVLAIYCLAIFMPLLAVQVRRLHDCNESGWMFLVGFIPYIGTFILIWMMARDGTWGENRYGPDQKQRNAATLQSLFD